MPIRAEKCEVDPAPFVERHPFALEERSQVGRFAVHPGLECLKVPLEVGNAVGPGPNRREGIAAARACATLCTPVASTKTAPDLSINQA